MEYKGDPFLKELWERKAAHEAGDEILTVTHANRKEKIKASELNDSTKLLQEMKKSAEEDAELKKIFKELESAVVGYVESVDRFHIGNIDRDKEEMQRVDSFRKSAHDALYDAVNRFSRECKKRDIDNSWRGRVGSGKQSEEDRKQVGRWAMKTAHVLIKGVAFDEEE